MLNRCLGVALVVYATVTCWLWMTFALVPALALLLPLCYPWCLWWARSGALVARQCARQWSDAWQALYITQFAALVELLFNVRIVVTGDAARAHYNNEKALVIANHRTRLDWLFLWHLVIRHLSARQQKIALKKQLERVPIFGVAIHLIQFV